MQKNSHLAYIDGLRGVAVTAVVAFHCALPFSSGGFIGVDVFFVISGFLITQLLSREIERTGSVNFISFYTRRVSRLFPSLLLVLICTLILAALLLSPQQREVQEVGRAAIATSLFSSNIYFAWWLNDYFGGPSEFQPLLHTWSLCVEEQFYFVWPFLLWLAGTLAQRSGIPFRTVGLATVLLVTLSSVLAALLCQRAYPDLVFFWTPFRAWEFGIGALLAYWPASGRPRLTQSAEALGVLGLSLVLASIVLVSPGAWFPAPLAIVPVAGTGLIILAHQLKPELMAGRLLTMPPAMWLGRVSYAWYLWHFPLLAITKLVLLEQDPIRDAAVALISLLLAEATVRFVEGPLRFDVLPRLRSGLVLLGGAVCSAGAACAAVGVGLWAQSIAVAKPIEPTPPLVQTATYRRLDDAAARNTQIFVLGDSHVGNIVHAIDAWSAAASRNAEPVFRMQTSCLPLRGVTPVIANHRQAECAHVNERRYEGISAPGDTAQTAGVVLAARWTMYSGQQNISVYEPWVGRIDERATAQDSARTLLEDKLRSEIAGFAAKSVRVVLVLSPPELKFHPGKCLERLPPEKCSTRKSDYLTHQTAIRDVTAALAKEFPDHFRVFDPTDVFCPADVCAVKFEGRDAYSDSNHLARHGSLALAAGFAPLLDWVSRSDGHRQPRNSAP